MLLLLSMLACNSATKPDTSVYDGPKNVLLLVLDGVRVQEFTTDAETSEITGKTGEDWAPSTWKTLGENGTVVRSIYNVGPTLTAPSHANLFAGRRLFYGNMPTVEGESSLYRPTLPTLFEEAQRQLSLPSADIRFVANAPLLQDLACSLYPHMTPDDSRFQIVYGSDGEHATDDDADVFRTVKDYISDNHPRLLVANVHQSDWDGHFNTDPNAYEQDVAAVDKQIGELYDWLKSAQSDYFSKTVFVITTDHGRHLGADEAFREHGDSCRGCRSLPLFVAGPGIPKQELTNSLIIQEDLSMMIASWLGIQLPYGVGLPVPELGNGMDGRQGVTSLSMTMGHQAEQHWFSDPLHRNGIYYDGEMVSAPNAFAAEAPGLVVIGENSYLCWRQLYLDPGQIPDGDSWPWQPTCSVRTGNGAWTPMNFPVREVSSTWRPVMKAVGQALVMAWVDNVEGVTATEAKVDAAIFDPGTHQWTPVGQYEGLFPTRVSLSVSGADIWIAVGENNGDASSRYNRQIAVIHTNTNQTLFLDPSAVLGGGVQRVENAAIYADGNAVHVAALGFNEDGNHVLSWESQDGGQTFGPAREVTSPEEPFAHLTPFWDGTTLYWAVLGEDGKASFCRSAPGQEVSCQDTGFPRIDSYTVQDGTVWAAVDAGTANWQIQPFQW